MHIGPLAARAGRVRGARVQLYTAVYISTAVYKLIKPHEYRFPTAYTYVSIGPSVLGESECIVRIRDRREPRTKPSYAYRLVFGKLAVENSWLDQI